MTDGVLCPVCSNLLGCPHLEGRDGKFDEDLIALAGEDTCPDFLLVMDRERRGVRSRLFEMSGLGYLRILHGLPPVALKDLRNAEEMEQMYEAVPDFQDPTLLWEGMTQDEREEKLTYETDEEGNVIHETDEEGNVVKRRRQSYHLKTYVTTAFDVPVETALRWSTNQLISHILKEEKKAGWVTRASKDQEKEMARATVTRNATAPSPVGPPPRVQPPAAVAPPPAAAPPPAQAAANPKPPGGRVARPPVRPGAKPATPAAAAAAAPAAAPAPAIDVKALVAEVTKAVKKEMEKALAKEIQIIRDELAVMHDLLVSTKGTMWYEQTHTDGQPVLDENGYPLLAPLPTLSDKPSKLSAHLDGTAYTQGE